MRTTFSNAINPLIANEDFMELEVEDTLNFIETFGEDIPEKYIDADFFNNFDDDFDDDDV